MTAFEGFLRVYREARDEDAPDDGAETRLPALRAGETVSVGDVRSERRFTRPPPRYSEAGLVRALEERGIGRPSTYAAIVGVLRERDYVLMHDRRFVPTERGRVVTAFLHAFFGAYVAYGFTADLERNLDRNVLLDALLTPPRADAHQNSRHFYESARAIIAGYMAWVRFKEPPKRRALANVHRMLSMAPEQRKAFAELVQGTDRFAGGLTHIAVERQAQVGKEEGGSNFTTIANQLAFLTHPELLASTRTSSFDPLTQV